VDEALEHDLTQALTEMVQDPKLVPPAFLRHRMAVLADTLDLWNQSLYTILNHGVFRKIPLQELHSWRPMFLGKNTPISSIGGYVSQEVALQMWCHEEDQKAQKESQSTLMNKTKKILSFASETSLIEKALTPPLRDSCFHAVRLLMELDATKRYQYLLESLLKEIPEQCLLLAFEKKES